VESRTERENKEPNLAIPKTDRDDPIRAKLRKDSDEPKCRKSITDTDDPIRE
jgi:hypothetical protein